MNKTFTMIKPEAVDKNLTGEIIQRICSKGFKIAALKKTQISKKQALLRIPFQIPLIIIAYWHSKENSKEWFSYLCLLIFIPTILYFINL